MSNQKNKQYPIEEAVRVQKALRDLAGLGPEMFPIEAFVGMTSDEEIARAISTNSKIVITADEIAANYASPEDRHPPKE